MLFTQPQCSRDKAFGPFRCPVTYLLTLEYLNVNFLFVVFTKNLPKYHLHDIKAISPVFLPKITEK